MDSYRGNAAEKFIVNKVQNLSTPRVK